MADESEGEPLDVLEEEEGGPIKSFLEHLEDLRWVLIKSLDALGVAMIICFFGGNHVFRILEMPLLKEPFEKYRKGQTARRMLGTNQLAVFQLGGTNILSSFVGETNKYVRLELVPVTIGTNQVLALSAEGESKVPAQVNSP